MENPAIFFISIWLVFVAVLIFVLLKVTEKRRKGAVDQRIQSVKTQLQYIQDYYLKDKEVKFAYAYSTNSMCQTTGDKAKSLAKNAAKAVIRTTLTGRASYRGSEIGSRNYLIAYDNQTLYFFYVYASQSAVKMDFNEDEFFSVAKEKIKNITLKDKKEAVIYIDFYDGGRLGFKLNDKILNEVDFKDENEAFKVFMINQAALIAQS
ncbi:MAG: hypothetical protein ACLROI_02025 [Beduini sp.]|uniref:hypothetical protein n=1 Tax=Beduini sp. TaxID=1922300 RepID=UPI0011CB1B4A